MQDQHHVQIAKKIRGIKEEGKLNDLDQHFVDTLELNVRKAGGSIQSRQLIALAFTLFDRVTDLHRIVTGNGASIDAIEASLAAEYEATESVPKEVQSNDGTDDSSGYHEPRTGDRVT